MLPQKSAFKLLKNNPNVVVWLFMSPNLLQPVPVKVTYLWNYQSPEGTLFLESVSFISLDLKTKYYCKIEDYGYWAVKPYDL